MVKFILVPTIDAAEWNKERDASTRSRPLQGNAVTLYQAKNGVVLNLKASGRYSHPWSLSPRWKPNQDADGGQWVAIVEPGFVAGQDVMILESRDIEGTPTSLQIPLTDEIPPEIVLGAFRDPAASQGLSATIAGELLLKPGEGYPKWFETIGVKPAAKGGKITREPIDTERTREIRACDLILITPRLAARQEIQLLSPIGDQQSVQLSTAISSAAIRTNPHHRLNVVSKWTPPQQPTNAERLLGTYVEPEQDEILIATVYFVSPPNAGEDAQPDHTWECFPCYSVFWNLAHACQAITPDAEYEPLQFALPLAGGIGQRLVDAMLAPVNDSLAQVQALLDATSFQGMYWTPGGVGLDAVRRPRPGKEPTKETGFDSTARRKAREAVKAASAAAIPPLNPPFPFMKTRFDPWFFGLESAPKS